MTTLLGINTDVGIKLSASSDTWGTENAVDTRLVCESISWSENPEKLQSAGIGSGGFMTDNMQRGALSVSGQIVSNLEYNLAVPQLLAQFFGTESISSELTSGQGDYRHTFKFNSTLNSRYFTLAAETSSTTTVAFPSCAITKIQIEADGVPNYAKVTFDFIANLALLTSSTNTNSVLGALGSGQEFGVIDQADSFLINISSGASLSSSDLLAIKKYSLSLERPQEFVNEIKGSSGNSAPVQTDKIVGSLGVDLKQVDDNTYLTAAQSGTEYKATLSLDGSQIGTGNNRSYTLEKQRMIIVDTPTVGWSSPGINPYSINFDIIQAASAPSGTADVVPVVQLVNAVSSAYV